MILGCIADDFTGAGDIASILATAGMRTSIVTRIESVADADADAVVVALKSRSIPAADAVTQSLDALAALRAAGCEQIVFKYCSTFDSTPEGNIGPVAEALADALGARCVVVCPAFPANGRTVYQGNLFVGDVPLSESGMRNHPLTPMVDSDIRRWLKRQTKGTVGHVALDVVRRGVSAIKAALARGDGLMVMDAIDDADLLAIGAALVGAPLLTGGSAIAQGLPANFAGRVSSSAWAPRPNSSPALVLAGSCSDMTTAQVAQYRGNHPSFAIPVERLLRGDPVLEEAIAFAVSHAAAAPLIHSPRSEQVVPTDAAPGAALAIERLMAAVATAAVARGVGRIVVAGGETSGAVVSALGTHVLDVGSSIAPGVPILYAGKLSLALKSGNFGAENFFERAISMLEATA